MSSRISRTLAGIIATSAALSAWYPYDAPIEQKGNTCSYCKKCRGAQNVGHAEKVKANRRKANKNARKARKRNR